MQVQKGRTYFSAMTCQQKLSDRHFAVTDRSTQVRPGRPLSRRQTRQRRISDGQQAVRGDEAQRADFGFNSNRWALSRIGPSTKETTVLFTSIWNTHSW